MGQQSFKQLKYKVRNQTGRQLLNGVQPSRAANSLVLLERAFAGGNLQKITQSNTSAIFRCNINFCEQPAVFCGP